MRSLPKPAAPAVATTQTRTGLHVNNCLKSHSTTPSPTTCYNTSSNTPAPTTTNHRRPSIKVNRTNTSVNTLDDPLSKLICVAASEYLASANWEKFVVKQQGFKSDLYPNIKHLKHSASDLLEHIRKHRAPAPMLTSP